MYAIHKLKNTNGDYVIIWEIKQFANGQTFYYIKLIELNLNKEKKINKPVVVRSLCSVIFPAQSALVPTPKTPEWQNLYMEEQKYSRTLSHCHAQKTPKIHKTNTQDNADACEEE